MIEGDFQNGPNPHGGGYKTNQRGDSHLIVWDLDNNLGYELYGVSRPADPTLFPNTDGDELTKTDQKWHAAQETVWNFKTDSFRTLGATSADAAGLSILAGLARPDEAATVAQGGQGAITHALRMTLPDDDINPQYILSGIAHGEYVAGRQQSAARRTHAAEEQLTVNAVINNMPPQSQIVARDAEIRAHRRGHRQCDVVTGTSASKSASNTISQRWDLDDIFASNGLQTLTAADFEVVDLTPVVNSLSAASGHAGSLSNCQR